MNGIKVVILCGGIGKRMAPLTIDKALISFAGKPLIVHQMETAMNAGLNDFIIICNPENKSELESLLASKNGLKSEFILQKKAKGMADALLNAANTIADNPFMLVSSNDVFDRSAYSSILEAYKQDNSYSAYVTAYQVNSYFPGGYLAVNDRNEIRSIIEKPGKGKEPSDLINIVLHLHTNPKLLFNYLNTIRSDADDIYEKSLDRMISDNNKLKAVQYTGTWQAIKYPWHILDVMDIISSGIKTSISKSAKISDRAIVEGNVIISDNVKIFENAVIRGPSYIGENTIIGTNTLVRQSFIGKQCVVGYNTEVKHAFIGDNCWFHSNYIGDSILESDCSFGAGAITANFRLDETNIKVKDGHSFIDTGHDKLGIIIGKGSRIGINTSIMPGIKIGPNAFVGPHICLTDHLAAEKMAIAETPYLIQDNITRLSGNKRLELFNNLDNKKG
jgi:UDP-N-acetylglucosamine diphosphorylase / glucose-1-phosphate thymidylyltransferase / UDP-N-acetylgalactosamine diphosphorylase / glucosamine-1-phosphate N-acetyltransferase / galactosamine-1-phosphate N-acetyltransferase